MGKNLRRLRDELAATNAQIYVDKHGMWFARLVPVIRAEFPAHIVAFERDFSRPPCQGVVPCAPMEGCYPSPVDPQDAINWANDGKERLLHYLDSLIAISQPEAADGIDSVLKILRRFEVAARALRSRPREDKKKFGYVIADEYDVQDLLYALLKPLVEDLEREAPVPKTAGVSGRVDLCSTRLGLVLEVKFAKAGGGNATKLVKECNERVVTYAAGPGLEHLVFFVYDPDGVLPDRDNFISGLSTPASIHGKSFAVDAVVAP